MNVVALISGGKDSCYCMMECVKRGHKIVAMANLLPMNDEDHDIDSWMYQTVAHEMIDYLSCCLPGVPMYRRRIKGQAKSTSLSYEQSSGDEVEDLWHLLKWIGSKHGEINAVCSGAILSNYQRLRVEHVCWRLGWTSLAFLWEPKEQRSLLQSMIDDGVHAVLVKVASMGLIPNKHLGLSLEQMFPLLKKYEKEFGCSVCGEGGEFETFVLDCPLFENRIELLECEKKCLSNDPISPVGLLIVKKFQLISKKTLQIVENAKPNVVCFDEEFKGEEQDEEEQREMCEVALKIEKKSVGKYHFCRVSCEKGDARCYEKICETILKRVPGRSKCLLHVSVQCSNMEDFVAFNRIYSRYQEMNEPPSRAVFQLDHSGAFLADALFVEDVEGRKSLHVQSISKWAPACIGPYSQCVVYDDLLFLSGQIHLVSDTMKLSEVPSIQLCLDHVEAVLTCQGSSLDCVVFCRLLVANGADVDLSLVPDNAVVSVVAVSKLPRNATFEVVCIASMKKSYKKEIQENGSQVSRHCRGDKKMLGFAVGEDIRLSNSEQMLCENTFPHSKETFFV